MNLGKRAKFENILRNVISDGHSCIRVTRLDGKTVFFCLFCDEYLNDESELQCHLIGQSHQEESAISLVRAKLGDILKSVLSEGHSCIEVRSRRKNTFFFCYLCDESLKDESELRDHLTSPSHPEKLANSCIEVKREEGNTFFCFLCDERLNDESRLRYHLTTQSHPEKLGNVNLNLQKRNPWPFNDGVFFFHDAHLKLKSLQQLVGTFPSELNLHQNEANADGSGIPSSSALNVAASGRILANPDVLLKGKASLEHIGIGKIGARFYEKDGVSNKLVRVWCEWVGKSNEGLERIPQHEFDVVTLFYHSSMDRQDFSNHIISCLGKESQLSDEDESSGEGSQSSSSIVKNMVHQLFKDTCDMCYMEMDPNTEVATLYNRKIDKLVCSIGNYTTDVFHVYHVSCLLRWILIFEVKTFEEHTNYPVFCPACVGIDGIIEEDDVLTRKREEVSALNSKIWESRRKWKIAPELLENNSIGLCIPEKDEEEFQMLKVLKWLRFYRYRTG